MSNMLNYYEMDLYCKSEGLNTDFFLSQCDCKKRHKVRRLLGILISLFAI